MSLLDLDVEVPENPKSSQVLVSLESEPSSSSSTSSVSTSLSPTLLTPTTTAYQKASESPAAKSIMEESSKKL